MPPGSATAEISDPLISSIPAAAVAGAPKHTYGQILKSTALMGGSSAVNIAFSIVRTKAMAVLLGPSGVGLLGLYGSIADLTQAVASMGIQNSGVRQIAEAVGAGDDGHIARTATVLRRISLLLGLIGAGLLVLFARPVSAFTFGTTQHATGVALLSVAVLCRLVSAGQTALIQGLRRISDLAKMSVLAAFFGTVISIPFVYVWGEDGVVPSLIAVAAVSILTSWWYSHKAHIRTPPIMTAREVGRESGALLKLGLAFMASAFLTMGAAYAIRIIVLHVAGVEAAGLYQAAWALGGLYVGFILQAMGSDFYPRLTAVSQDNAECNRLVNEQAQISLLLAGPGVITTLTFAPLVMSLFYSAAFGPAVAVLRWICLGMTLRVVAFPMGYIVLAKGAQKVFFWTEIAATVVHVGLAWLLVPHFGVSGAGAAFMGLYAWHSILIYTIVHRMTGFRWSPANRKLALVILPATGAVFAAFYLLPSWLATGLGTLSAMGTGWYSARTLLALVPEASIPEPARSWLLRLGVPMRIAGRDGIVGSSVRSPL
jgi:PST family polysaccharide transporter